MFRPNFLYVSFVRGSALPRYASSSPLYASSSPLYAPPINCLLAPPPPLTLVSFLLLAFVASRISFPFIRHSYTSSSSPYCQTLSTLLLRLSLALCRIRAREGCWRPLPLLLVSSPSFSPRLSPLQPAYLSFSLPSS